MPFFASALVASVTIVAALLPPLHVPGVPDAPHASLYPAPPGYLLPWTGGEIHGVTQGEDTSFTHNGAAAYAFDFDLNYETVVAARSGKVTMVKADSNSGGCNSSYSSQTNYVVIDHGDGTSAAYMHLAYRGVLVKPGDLVEQGQPIAVSGETGVTCSADGTGPGPHLHLQVERTQPGQYFTQSLPIAFDDVSTTNGVPREGQSYVSENFGGGKAQTVKLTPRRVPRVFNPVARPKYPMLQEAPPPPPPTTATASPIGTAQPSQTTTPTAVPSTTLTPEASATLTATSTPVASATPTPQATDTPTPAATSTPTAATPTTPPDTPTAPPAPATAPTSGQDPSGAATSPPA